MKKVFCLLFIMILPIIVLADSSGPSIIGYDAVIINKNGAKVSDYNDGNPQTIAYNTKIHVYNEYDGEVSACYIENTKDCYSESFTISSKDIAILKDEVIPKDLDQKDNQGTVLIKTSSKLLISSEKGIKLRKGPAEAYGYYETKVPYKTVLNFEYAISQSGPGRSYSWVYIDDGKYKGWIDQNDVNYFIGPVLTFTDITIYDENKRAIKIPAETVLDTVYRGYPTTYIEYNGVLGKIESENTLPIGQKSKLGYIFTVENIEVKSKGKTITAIPKGEKIKIIYASADNEYWDNPYHTTDSICIKESECYYYVEYNGAKGFIADNDSIISLAYEDETKDIKLDHDLEMYDIEYYDSLDDGVSLDEHSNKHKLNTTVPANTTITAYMDRDIYQPDPYKSYEISLIKYKNNIGWVITKIDIDEENSEIVEEKDTKKDHVLSIIVYSMIAAGILALTSLVIIKLINKKKIEKNNNVKEIAPIKKK